MDTTDKQPEERNENKGPTFDLKDPYEKPLDTYSPAEETDSQEAPEEPEKTEPQVAAPVVPETTDNTSVDEGDDETIPSHIPIEMKEALGDYIDEDLAANVRALVDKVASLETDLQKERSRATAAKKTAVEADKFAGIWDSENGKFGGVLSGDDAKDRIRGAMNVLRAGYKASQVDTPADTTLFEKAVSSEYGSSMVEAREKQITEQVEKRQNQFVSRAATTAPVNQSPEETAAKAVHRLMVDRGLYES